MQIQIALAKAQRIEVMKTQMNRRTKGTQRKSKTLSSVILNIS